MKLNACIEWVESEIAKTLEEDPSGFLLGIQSVSVVEALRDVAAERDALREAIQLWADEIRSLRAIIDSADRFAFHDPGVEWPGDKHPDPVDAICATLDHVREELAVEVDR